MGSLKSVHFDIADRPPPDTSEPKLIKSQIDILPLLLTRNVIRKNL